MEGHFVRTRRAPRLLAIALASLALGATTLATTSASAGAADSNSLSVTASEYTYKFGGSPDQGWVTMKFTNSGVEPHMMAVVKLKSGVTAAQLKKAALAQNDAAFAKIADPKNADVSGMPQLLSPKQSTTTTTEMVAGHYGVLCFVPDAHGMPHMQHGMVKTFDVGSAKSSAEPPADGVHDVTLTDTSITLPSTGMPKSGTLKVTNEGSSPHSMVLVKLAAGKGIDEAFTYFNTWFDSGTKPAGDEPGTVVGGVSTMAPNGVAYLTVDLAPGSYGYASTESDSSNAQDADKGLKGQFTIS